MDGTGPPPPPRGPPCRIGRPTKEAGMRLPAGRPWLFGRSLAEAKSKMEAGGHRQVADEMRQRAAAADEAAERTAFA